MSETCKHCGLKLKQIQPRGVPASWVHAEGPQETMHTCAVSPYGYDAAPENEPCSPICRAFDPTLASSAPSLGKIQIMVNLEHDSARWALVHESDGTPIHECETAYPTAEAAIAAAHLWAENEGMAEPR